MPSYESIFPGSSYMTLEPSYYTPPINNYQISVGDIGAAVDPRTANQLGELNLKMNPGVKTIEIQGINPQTIESIPEQHLDEMKRLSKLTGVTPTLHGPMLEASGIGEGGFTEENRLGVEKQMESAVLRGHKLSPDGNIPVTFHSTAQLPEFRPHIMSTNKKGEREKVEQGLWIVNEESGQINQIKPEKRYFPEEGKFTEKEIEFDSAKELKRRNAEMWTESISNINRYADFGEDSLEAARRQLPGDLYNQIGKIDPSQIKNENDKKIFEDAQRRVINGQIYLRDSYRQMKSFFDRAWNNVDNNEDKQKLREFAQSAAKVVEEGFERDPEKLEELRGVVEKGLKTLQGLNETPQLFKPLDEFVIDKSAETLSNVAKSAYKKYGDKAPILSIENPPANQGLSTGEDLRNLIIASRKEFSKKLQKDGISAGKADSIAAKQIGATWDVGHINMLRKRGYTEKEVVEQTKKIAPFVKHVHLSDNFGLDHTELPMGMGNVPLKPMMDEIKKAGFEGQQIVEAGNWWQYFADKGGGNPFKPTLEAFDSPIYTMKEGPSWAYAGSYGAYFGGIGPINPPVHHNTYGAGFQTLPIELGGEIPGDRGRMAGTPNQ